MTIRLRRGALPGEGEGWGAAIHLALDELGFVDLPLGLSIRPWLPDGSALPCGRLGSRLGRSHPLPVEKVPISVSQEAGIDAVASTVTAVELPTQSG